MNKKNMLALALASAFPAAVFSAAPIGVNDHYATPENQPIVISTADLLNNDSDPDGDLMSIAFIDDWVNGVASLDSAAGTITFTPSGTGDGSFFYVISDGTEQGYEGLGYGQVFIAIQSGTGNTPPVAGDDSFTGSDSEALIIHVSDLLSNDADADPDDTLSIVSVGAASLGQTSYDAAAGIITYTPTAAGSDSFIYTISDGESDDQATVSLTITDSSQPNRPPVGVNDLVDISINQTVTITAQSLTVNDDDADDDPLSILFIDDWQNGQAQFDTNTGSITFTPDTDFVGTASFMYIITDGHHSGYEGLGYATVTINVAATQPSGEPVANSDSFETGLNTPLDIAFEQLLLNDSDPNDDILTIESVTAGANGTVEMDSGAQQVQFVPAQDATGIATFTYTLSDGNGNTAQATVTVQITDDSEPPLEGPRDYARVFVSGHSLTSKDMASFVEDFAANVGDDYQYDTQLIGGSTISFRTRGWENGADAWDGQQWVPEWETWDHYALGDGKFGPRTNSVIDEMRNPTNISSGRYDTLIITEVHDIVGQLRSDSTHFLRHYHDRLRESSSDGVTMLYHSWQYIFGRDDATEWLAFEKDMQYAWECLASATNQTLLHDGLPQNVQMLPAGGALADLVERAIAGQVPGIGGSTENIVDRLFVPEPDGDVAVHLTPLGDFFISAVVYHATMRKEPVLTGIPARLAGEPSATLQALMQIAADYVTNYYQQPNKPWLRPLSECRDIMTQPRPDAESVCMVYERYMSDPNNPGDPDGTGMGQFCESFFQETSNPDNVLSGLPLTLFPAPQ